jgi:hypothetical protein
LRSKDIPMPDIVEEKEDEVDVAAASNDDG